MIGVRLGTVLLAAVFALAVACADEPWAAAYQRGLAAAKDKDWTTARAAFQEAAKLRPGDDTAETVFRTSPTRPERWRNGAPYSPNFAAAYCAYRLGKETADAAAAKPLFETARDEAQALVAKEELNLHVYYIVAVAMAELGQAEEEKTLLADLRAKRDLGKLKFRIDTAMMLDTDLAAARKLLEPPQSGNTQVTPTPGAGTGGPAPVPYVETKYAILIGVSQYHGSIGNVPNAVNDCKLLKDALTKNAGYDPAHVTILEEPTYQEMFGGVQDFAAALPPGATVFFFFAGAGRANPENGRDYLIPSGAANVAAFGEFVPMADLLALIGPRAGYTISVIEVNRDEANSAGKYYGSEIPTGGSFAHMNACMETQRCQIRATSEGVFGLWPLAAAWVLENRMRGCSVNAYDFVFELNQRILDVNQGTTSATKQTPVLPNYSMLGREDGNF